IYQFFGLNFTLQVFGYPHLLFRIVDVCYHDLLSVSCYQIPSSVIVFPASATADLYDVASLCLICATDGDFFLAPLPAHVIKTSLYLSILPIKASYIRLSFAWIASGREFKFKFLGFITLFLR